MLIAAYCPNGLYYDCTGKPLLTQGANELDYQFVERVRTTFDIGSPEEWNSCVDIIEGHIVKVTMRLPDPKPEFLWHNT